MYAYKIQMVKESKKEYPDCTISNSETAAKLAAQYIGLSDREMVVILAIDCQLKITGIHTLAMGCLDSCIVHPRELLKFVILSNAASFIMVHNHPSGNLTASESDIKLTKRVALVAKIMDIQFHDHIIVNYKGEYNSLTAKGYLDISTELLRQIV